MSTFPPLPHKRANKLRTSSIYWWSSRYHDRRLRYSEFGALRTDARGNEVFFLVIIMVGTEFRTCASLNLERVISYHRFLLLFRIIWKETESETSRAISLRLHTTVRSFATGVTWLFFEAGVNRQSVLVQSIQR